MTYKLPVPNLTYRMRRLVLALTLAGFGAQVFAAPTMPTSGKGSKLYYELGGSDAAGRAPNNMNISLKLGLQGTAGLNYSCGKFSATLSLQNTLNQFSNLGPVITNAVKAGIAALPMYILQRAQPGLYELIQTYIFKAEALVNKSFETCEQMEQQIKDGKNPYDQYISLAMGEGWKDEANKNGGGGDVVQAKQNVQTNGGNFGFTWVFGTKAGGTGQPAAKIVGDTVTAAYNLTQMRPVNSSPSANYSATGNRLAKAFATPASAATFATETIGDIEVSICSTPGNCAKSTKTGIGLQRKVEDEIPIASAQIATLLGSAVPTTTDLDAASTPGVLVTRDLVDALRSLPKAEQAIASNRLAQEIAVARTIDRALLIRQMLMTGKTIPETMPPTVVEPINTKLTELNRSIDDLMYEVRVRKEMVSSSATTLLDAYRSAKASSAANGTTVPAENRPLLDGRVQ